MHRTADVPYMDVRADRMWREPRLDGAARDVVAETRGPVADTEELFTNPRHPYSHSLLSAAPIADPKAERTRRRIVLRGEAPPPADPPSGCAFRTRCPVARDACAQTRPPLAEQGSSRHFVACLFPVHKTADLLTETTS
jgi:oligopeptide/dipeptide ABC transporter ATP-binding protein